MSAHEHDLPAESEWPDVLDFTRKVHHLLRCIDLADSAAQSMATGDLVGACSALRDYESLRLEFADVNLDAIDVPPLDPLI